MSKLTKEARKKGRIAILKDVIAQIKSGFLSVESLNGYLVPTERFNLTSILDSNHQLEPITKDQCSKLQKHCSVCAKGALFLSRIDKFNKVSVGHLLNIHNDYDGFHDPSPYLIDYFDKAQLDLIEEAFEPSFSYSGPESQLKKKYWSDIPDDTDRLMAICQNAIDHNGIFNPKVEYQIV